MQPKKVLQFTVHRRRSLERQKLDEKEMRDLHKMKLQMEKGHAVSDVHLYRVILYGDKYKNSNNGAERCAAGHKYRSHEIRAGDVLQLRLQGQNVIKLLLSRMLK